MAGTQHRVRPYVLQLLLHWGRRKRDHLHRKREAAQPLDDFVFIGHDHQSPRRSSNDFLVQQRAPAPFDQRQPGSNLVGAVNGHVGIGNFIEAGERNIQRARQLATRSRGRDPANLQSVAD